MPNIVKLRATLVVDYELDLDQEGDPVQYVAENQRSLLTREPELFRDLTSCQRRNYKVNVKLIQPKRS